VPSLRRLIEIKANKRRDVKLSASKKEAGMPAEVQITFRGMETSPSVEAQVRRRIEELYQISDRIAACRVVLEAAHRRHRQGMIYHVRIDLTVPGGPLVIAREPGEDHAHEDMRVAVRDAFDAARRRLQDRMRKLGGDVKQRATEAPA
jgi:ribosome-associated translation inhibitor RaiA